jgi:hypothetical protein
MPRFRKNPQAARKRALFLSTIIRPFISIKWKHLLGSNKNTEAKPKTRKKSSQKERNAIHSGETNKMGRKANLDLNRKGRQQEQAKLSLSYPASSFF